MVNRFSPEFTAGFAEKFRALIAPDIPGIIERAERAIAILMASNPSMTRDEAIEIYASMIGEAIKPALTLKALEFNEQANAKW